MRSLVRVWKMLIDQAASLQDSGVMESAEEFFKGYCEVFFSSECKQQVFVGLEQVNEETFEKVVENRFKTLKEIFNIRKANLVQELQRLGQIFFAETSVDFHKSRGLFLS